jgi:phage repressor protein C with HTH and peptisase S24 domain
VEKWKIKIIKIKKTRKKREKNKNKNGENSASQRQRKRKKKPSLTPLSPLGMAAAHSPNEGRVGDSALCPSFFTSVP